MQPVHQRSTLRFHEPLISPLQQTTPPWKKATSSICLLQFIIVEFKPEPTTNDAQLPSPRATAPLRPSGTVFSFSCRVSSNHHRIASTPTNQHGYSTPIQSASTRRTMH